MAQIEFIVSLIVLAILGIFDASYLIKKRIKKQPLTCPINGGCEKVTESKWNHILLIKNDVGGLLYYLLVLFLAIYLFFISNNLLVFTKIIAGASLLLSIFLTFIQIKIIREYCFYCLLSALINLLIFVNVLFL